MRAFLEAHGESRFTPLLPSSINSEPAPPELTRTVNRAGWRRQAEKDDDKSKSKAIETRPDNQDVPERWEFLILPETWKGEVCKGLDGRRTAEVVAARNLLLGGTARHRAALVTIPGEGKRRVYVESWAKDPAEDGRAGYFRNARVLGVEGAGHWVHHDRLDLFLREVHDFLT